MDDPVVALNEQVNALVEAKMKTLLHNVFYQPNERQSDHYSTRTSEPGELRCEFGMPVPPQPLMRGYAAAPEAFLRSGKVNFESMLSVMQDAGAGLASQSRILDFGCAIGRMTRWLRLLGEGREYWGVDVIGQDIFWARSSLSEWFNFLTTTRLPHLPFEDGYFDFVFACSVFSHIDDLADAWVLELRRITRPGGFLYLTLLDETSVEVFNKERREHLERDVLRGNPALIALFDKYTEAGVDMFTIGRSQVQSLRPESPQTFYNSTYIQKQWGKYFDVASYRPKAYGYQSAIVLTKPQHLPMSSGGRR